MNSFLTVEQLSLIGLKYYGSNVLISKHCVIYNPQNISIGHDVRIDDFVIISGGSGITIGNYVHIATHSGLWGGGVITIGDFVNISSGCKIYSESDDFSGETLVGPMIPKMYKTNMNIKPVYINKHVVIGANSVVLPGVTLDVGCAIGCGSVVNKSCDAWTIHAGTPIRYLKDRLTTLLEDEQTFKGDVQNRNFSFALQPIEYQPSNHVNWTKAWTIDGYRI